MDAIRTLLLDRTLTVILDPDRVANASTRPVRDVEIDKFEDELAQLGFVMSLDLSITLRRLPKGTLTELRSWMVDTLAKQVDTRSPLAPGDPGSTYLRRVLPWLATQVDQPCPWCSQVKPISPLDPCGHLVCRSCWAAGHYVGCPICHRRVAMIPFVAVPPGTPTVTAHGGALRLVHLAFDLIGSAQTRIARILSRPQPLPPDDRAELEVVIDAIGPDAVKWLPASIPIKETAAIAVARLWLVAVNRSAMVARTLGHLTTATDVLRVACVLMGGNAELVEPMRLRSLPRGMRRALVEALDRLPSDQVVEDVSKRVGLWKRVGERLHPYEWAERYPNAAVAFAVIRGTNLTTASFGADLRERARSIPAIAMGEALRVTAWGGPVEDSLRRGEPTAALDVLAQRPTELLRRADALVRASQDVPADLRATMAAIDNALPRGSARTLLTLVSHVATRTTPWPRRVFFPRGQVLHAWSTRDPRPPLHDDAIAAITVLVRRELVHRALARRHFARAVIDRALAQVLAPTGKPSDVQRLPRGTTLALPAGPVFRIVVSYAEPPGARVDLDVAVALYDGSWTYRRTRDLTPVPDHATTRAVELDAVQLGGDGIRYAAVIIGNDSNTPFDGLVRATVGITTPAGDVQRTVELHGTAPIVIPITIDLASRHARYVDLALPGRAALHRLGGFRCAIARLGSNLEAFATTGARPTLWDVAAIHAAARANLVYVRDGNGSVATYRRRDGEAAIERLGRLLAGVPDETQHRAVPSANAPTWLAVMTDDFALPFGSIGYIAESRGGAADGVERLTPANLVDELAPRQP